MRFTFVPDFYFETFDKADARFLNENGIKYLVLDIDNTLEPYENELPGEGVLAWFAELAANGIKAAFVSNNGRERVERFNSGLGLPMYYKARKPLSKTVRRAMRDMGATAEETALMGDQIFTDVWAARNSGIRAILVPPIKDKRDPFTRFKRLLERPVLKKYMKNKDRGGQR